MRRVHAFELLDQPWLPRVVRRLLTDYLATMLRLGRPFDRLAPQLAAAMREARTTRVIDLAAGGGGPWATLFPALERELGATPSVTLTDLHPVESAPMASVSRAPEPVDATCVPSTLGGVRTMFDGLHHFRPDAATAVLRDAVRNRAPILVGEALERRLALMLVAIFILPISVLLVTPLVRPRTLWRFALTYLVPLAPLAVAWDGVVSILRAYTPSELEALAKSADPEGTFQWTAGRARGPQPMTYLIGYPCNDRRCVSTS
jgi:hypothetical protein